MSAEETKKLDLMRNRLIQFRCATPKQLEHWRLGGPDEATHYTARDWRWQFCVEAYRPACVALREKGYCARLPAEWKRLLHLDTLIG